MADDESLFVLSLETTDQIELSSTRSLLEGAGLTVMVQGELHHQLMGGLFGNPAIAPRLLVKRDDEARARTLLASRPVVAEVCSVHEKPARSRCSVCDSALCEDCVSTGTPPVCESCVVERPEVGEVKRAHVRTARRFVAWLLLAPLILGFGALLVTLVMRALR